MREGGKKKEDTIELHDKRAGKVKVQEVSRRTERPYNVANSEFLSLVIGKYQGSAGVK